MERFAIYTDAQLESLWQGWHTLQMCSSKRDMRLWADKEVRAIEVELARRGLRGR